MKENGMTKLQMPVLYKQTFNKWQMEINKK